MARAKLVECSFLIPIRRDPNLSDGKAHPRKTWKWLDDELFDFGGATMAQELYEGWYRDPDTRKPVRDISKKYFVALPRSELSALRELLQIVCQKFAQKCIYLSVAGDVEFVERPNDEKE